MKEKPCCLFRMSESSEGFLVLSRKSQLMESNQFIHSLVGRHRPGDPLISWKQSIECFGDTPVRPEEIGHEFYFEAKDPTEHFANLRELVAAKGRREQANYEIIPKGSGYESTANKAALKKTT